MNETNDNIKLLNFIYKNAEMGEETLKHLYELYPEENEFKTALREQLCGYAAMRGKARDALRAVGCDEKGIGKLEEMKTYLMINMQTITDKSSAHIAEMLITGSTMGITDCIKSMRECKTADKEIRTMAENLEEYEQSNIERLKKFL